MKFNDFHSSFKESLQNMQESSIRPLLEKDMDYQTYTRASGKAEQAYMDLDLTKEQREIVSALLDCRDNAYSEYSVLAYLAGLADGARIFAMLDILH